MAAGWPPPDSSGMAFAGRPARGAAIYGECGGYMVMGESLVDADGRRHAMAGLLPVATSFAERRLHLGYRQVALQADAAIGRPARSSAAMSSTTPPSCGRKASRCSAPSTPVANPLGPMGLRRGRVAGSFCHLIDSA